MTAIYFAYVLILHLRVWIQVKMSEGWGKKRIWGLFVLYYLNKLRGWSAIITTAMGQSMGQLMGSPDKKTLFRCPAQPKSCFGAAEKYLMASIEALSELPREVTRFGG